jgi:UDP-GlcNAc:undecaprenyl-phosphate/decaprenyl-phosphate GlcNAc-1-phosphate transferase
MKEYGLTVLVAAAVTYLLTPLVRKFAIWFGAWHEPRERDVHTEPVPELGGLAIYCGVAAALLVASRMFPLSGVFAGTRVGSGLLLAGGVVVLIGVVDDRWGLGALTKLVGQIGAGAILVWSGAVVGWLPVPGGGTLALTADQETALTILLVVLTINAVNFIDGLDGLATGIVGIGAAAFYLYYYTLAKRLGLSEQTDPALASAVLAGVCLGFLPHNFHPARIFLGDTGAMLLGLLLAYVPISSLASLDPNTLTTPSAYSGGTVNRFPEILPLLLPATILLIPYVDLLLAVVRRTRAGQSPWQADKKHLHHRLLDIGHSHRTSVLIMYLWATLFAGTVVLLSIIRTKLPVLGVVTLAGFLVLLWLTMPRLRPWGRHGGSRPVPAVASPVPGGRPAGPVPANRGPANPVPANRGPVNPALAHPAAARPMPSNPVPSNPVPSNPVPSNSGPANPAPARPGPGQPGSARPATDAARTGPAGYDTPAGYDASAGNGTRAS